MIMRSVFHRARFAYARCTLAQRNRAGLRLEVPCLQVHVKKSNVDLMGRSVEVLDMMTDE